MKKIFEKLTLSLSFIYLFTNVAFAYKSEENFWKQRTAASPVDLVKLPALSTLSESLQKSLPNRNTNKDLALFHLPATFLAHVNLRAVHRGNGQSSVIVLEDVHMNTEAQKNLELALSSIKDQSLTVGLEGASGVLPFDLWKKLEHKQIAAKIADDFYAKNKISGPAHVGFSEYDSRLHFVGADDATLYNANVEAYRQHHSVKATVARQLSQEESRLSEAKAQAFNLDLKNFDALVEAYRSGQLGLGEYLSQAGHGDGLCTQLFLEAYAMEKNLDFSKVDRERTIVLEKLVPKLSSTEMKSLMDLSLGYQQGQISFANYYQHLRDIAQHKNIDLHGTPFFERYIQYVLLSDGIKPEQLFSETQQWEQSHYQFLARTNEEKKLIRDSRQLYLTKKLTQFEMTSDEWDEYKATSHAALVPYESFYALADQRSEKMFQGLKDNTVHVLVVGGFHTKKLKKLFEKQNISYFVASPKITKVDAGNASAYLSIFDRDKSTLEKIFSGEKLFLAPNPTGDLPAMTKAYSEEIPAGVSHNENQILKQMAGPSAAFSFGSVVAAVISFIFLSMTPSLSMAALDTGGAITTNSDKLIVDHYVRLLRQARTNFSNALTNGMISISAEHRQAVLKSMDAIIEGRKIVPVSVAANDMENSLAWADDAGFIGTPRISFGENLSDAEKQHILTHEAAHLTELQQNRTKLLKELGKRLPQVPLGYLTDSLTPLTPAQLKEVALNRVNARKVAAMVVRNEVEAYMAEFVEREKTAKELGLSLPVYYEKLATESKDPNMAKTYRGFAAVLTNTTMGLPIEGRLSVRLLQTKVTPNMYMVFGLIAMEEGVNAADGREFSLSAWKWLNDPAYYNPPEIQKAPSWLANVLGEDIGKVAMFVLFGIGSAVLINFLAPAFWNHAQVGTFLLMSMSLGWGAVIVHELGHYFEAKRQKMLGSGSILGGILTGLFPISAQGPPEARRAVALAGIYANTMTAIAFGLASLIFFSSAISPLFFIFAITNAILVMAEFVPLIPVFQTAESDLVRAGIGFPRGRIDVVNPLPENIAAVVFDWEGTIQHSARIIDALEVPVFSRHIFGDNPTESQTKLVQDYIEKNHIPLSDHFKWAHDMRGQVRPNLPKTKWEPAFQEFLVSYEELARQTFKSQSETWQQTMPLVNGIVPLLTDIKNRNVYQCVATSVLERIKIYQAEFTGLSELFQHIYGDQSKSFPKGEYSKVAVLKKVASERGLRATQVAFFEDSVSAIKSAAEAGFIAIGIADTAEKVQAMKLAGAHIVIRSDYRQKDKLLKLLFQNQKRPSLIAQKISSFFMIGLMMLSSLSTINNMFASKTVQLKAIASEVSRQILQGVKGSPESLKMFNTFAPDITGREKGLVVTADMGGSTGRIRLVWLNGDGTWQVLAEPPKIYFSSKHKNNPILAFEAMANVVRDMLLQYEKENPGKSLNLDELKMSLSFAFPVNQQSLSGGELIHWDKEWQDPVNGEKIVGQDIAAVFSKTVRNSLEAVNKSPGNLRVNALINDTLNSKSVQTYILRAKNPQAEAPVLSTIGGTGHNTAISIDGKTYNMESGAFNPEILAQLMNEFDIKQNNALPHPEKYEQLLEKLTAASYMNELFRLALINRFPKMYGLVRDDKFFGMSVAFSDQSFSMENIEKVFLSKNIQTTWNERRKIKALALAIATRSADLMAAEFIGAIRVVDENIDRSHIIAAEGGLFEGINYPGFTSLVQKGLTKLVGRKAKQIKIVFAAKSEGIGAAILALASDAPTAGDSLKELSRNISALRQSEQRSSDPLINILKQVPLKLDLDKLGLQSVEETGIALGDISEAFLKATRRDEFIAYPIPARNLRYLFSGYLGFIRTGFDVFAGSMNFFFNERQEEQTPQIVTVLLKSKDEENLKQEARRYINNKEFAASKGITLILVTADDQLSGVVEKILPQRENIIVTSLENRPTMARILEEVESQLDAHKLAHVGATHHVLIPVNISLPADFFAGWDSSKVILYRILTETLNSFVEEVPKSIVDKLKAGMVTLSNA